MEAPSIPAVAPTTPWARLGSASSDPLAPRRAALPRLRPLRRVDEEQNVTPQVGDSRASPVDEARGSGRVSRGREVWDRGSRYLWDLRTPRHAKNPRPSPPPPRRSMYPRDPLPGPVGDNGETHPQSGPPWLGAEAPSLQGVLPGVGVETLKRWRRAWVWGSDPRGPPALCLWCAARGVRSRLWRRAAPEGPGGFADGVSHSRRR